jgi:hypothetical protein
MGLRVFGGREAGKVRRGDRDDLDPDKARVIELKGNVLQLMTKKN